MTNEIKEIQEAFQGSLDNWADIMLDLQVKQLNRECRYTEQDMMNLLLLFGEVAYNLAFFKNPIADKKQEMARSEYFGKQLREIVIHFCGFDPSRFFDEK